MCSHRRDLAHITPHIYGEGCGHRLIGGEGRGRGEGTEEEVGGVGRQRGGSGE